MTILDGPYTSGHDKKILTTVQSGKVLTTSNGNEAGTLWKKLWRWTAKKGYQSIVCAPGLYDNWHTYESEEKFLKILNDDIKEFRFDGISK